MPSQNSPYDVMKRTLLRLLLLPLVLSLGRAADSVVVFNEINYHPATNELANEWIELHNQITIDIDLSAWSVRGGVDFTFAEGTIIPGGGHLVVAINPAALQTATGRTNIVGPFTGRLNNSSARLELRDRNDRVMDKLEYGDEGKWPLAPDGSGAAGQARCQRAERFTGPVDLQRGGGRHARRTEPSSGAQDFATRAGGLRRTVALRVFRHGSRHRVAHDRLR